MVNLTLPLRAAQLLLAIIALGLTSYVANWYNTRTLTPSPSQINFLVFTSVFALLASVYLLLTSLTSRLPTHKFATLALDSLTMLFWFAGFIALAVFLGGLSVCVGNVCRSAQAAVVFGALEWLLWMGSAVFAALHAWRTRGMGNGASAGKAQPDMVAQPHSVA
ncbi:hypothetical protein MMC20_004565 [Loxospora ochrophaea]|nr:hypothetical protein [Loxospora ochrophaea]